MSVFIIAAVAIITVCLIITALLRHFVFVGKGEHSQRRLLDDQQSELAERTMPLPRYHARHDARYRLDEPERLADERDTAPTQVELWSDVAKLQSRIDSGEFGQGFPQYGKRAA